MTGWQVDTTPRCPVCWKANPDFAHGVFEAVVITLAQPLEKANDEHWRTCPHCSANKPLDQCPEGWALWELLPNRIALAMPDPSWKVET